MYLILPDGFFSIVLPAADDLTKASLVGADVLAVRARDRRHLERLLAEFPTALAAVEIVESGPVRDYRWKAFVRRDALAQVLAALPGGVTWRNFKAAAALAWAHEDDQGFVAAVKATHATFARLQRADAAAPSRPRPSEVAIRANLTRLARGQHAAIAKGEDSGTEYWELVGAFAALAYASGLWAHPLSPDADDPAGASAEFSALVNWFLAPESGR